MPSTKSVALFQKAVDGFVNELPPEKKAQFAGTSYLDLQLEIAKLQNEQAKKRERSALPRIQPFLEAFNRYADVIDVFAQSTAFMPFIWGPVRLLLQMSSRWLPARDKLLKALERVGKDLPFIDKNASYLTNSRFEQIIIDIYVDTLGLLKLALRIIGSSRLQGLSAILWPPFDSQLDEVIEKFREDSHYLEKALQEEQFDLIIETRNKARQNLVISQRNQKLAYLQLIGNALKRPLTFHQQLEIGKTIRRRCPSTGSWLFSKATFKAWLSHPGMGFQLLRLCGIPGAGKTTLCSVIPEIIAREAVASIVISAFCSWNDTNSTCIGVLASILYQLINKLPYSYELVAHQYGTELSRLYTVDNLVSCLDNILISSPTTYIILDGVDEMKENERKQLLESILNLRAQSGDWKLRVLISSRVESDIDTMLKDESIITITADENSEDIKTYLTQKDTIEDLRLSIDVDRPIVQGFLEALAGKVDGMFLYAKVVLDILRTQTSNLRQMRQVMDDHPDAINGLEAAYHRILERIEGQHKNIRKPARRILKLLLAANRPLRVEEIKYAVALEDGLPQVDEESRLRRTLEFYCGPIIEINSGVVRLVHKTARDYLLQHRENILGLNVMKAERLCARLTARYLVCAQFDTDVSSKPDFVKSMLVNGHYVFLNYAFQNWFKHAIKSQSKTTAVKSLYGKLHFPYETSLQVYEGFLAEDSFVAERDPSQLRGVVTAIVACIRDLEPVDNFKSLLSRYYGDCLYKCSQASCKMFLDGYPDIKLRNNHESWHTRNFTCTVEGCGHIITSDKMLQRHRDAVHREDRSAETPDFVKSVALPKSSSPSAHLPEHLLSDAIETQNLEIVGSYIDESIRALASKMAARKNRRGSVLSGELRNNFREVFSGVLEKALELEQAPVVKYILLRRQLLPNSLRTGLSELEFNYAKGPYILNRDLIISLIRKNNVEVVKALWHGLTLEQKVLSCFKNDESHLVIEELPYLFFQYGGLELAPLPDVIDIINGLESALQAGALETAMKIISEACRREISPPNPDYMVLHETLTSAPGLIQTMLEDSVSTGNIKVFHFLFNILVTNLRHTGNFFTVPSFPLELRDDIGGEGYLDAEFSSLVKELSDKSSLPSESQMSEICWYINGEKLKRELKSADEVHMIAANTDTIKEWLKKFSCALQSRAGQDVMKSYITRNTKHRPDLFKIFIPTLKIFKGPGPFDFHPIFIAPDVESIKKTLSYGADINVCDTTGKNAFCRQALLDHEYVIENICFLARMGADINQRDWTGLTALSWVLSSAASGSRGSKLKLIQTIQVLVGLGVDDPRPSEKAESQHVYLPLELRSVKSNIGTILGVPWEGLKKRWRETPIYMYREITNASDVLFLGGSTSLVSGG